MLKLQQKSSNNAKITAGRVKIGDKKTSTKSSNLPTLPVLPVF
jgi:hypothetical protein